jgi:acetyl esterase/lipase
LRQTGGRSGAFQGGEAGRRLPGIPGTCPRHALPVCAQMPACHLAASSFCWFLHTHAARPPQARQAARSPARAPTLPLPWARRGLPGPAGVAGCRLTAMWLTGRSRQVLNLYAPSVESEEAAAGVRDRLPVVVFVHGGGNLAGAGSRYGRSPLATVCVCVCVCVCVRVGVLRVYTMCPASRAKLLVI